MAKSEQRLALEAEYRKLAKRADQRLVRLEKAGSGQGYADPKAWAYAAAVRAIEHYSGPSKKPRFNRGMPDSDKLLRMKIKDIKSFLNMPTSTKSGIKSIASKRTKTMNTKYGIDLTSAQWAQVWESGLGDKLIAKFGSKTAFKQLANIRIRGNTLSSLAKQIKNAARDTTKTARLDRWMAKHGLTGEVDIDDL